MEESALTKASAELVKRGLETRKLKKELAKYKRAYEEICRQFNFGNENDYRAMHDAWLDWAKKEAQNGQMLRYLRSLELGRSRADRNPDGAEQRPDL